LSGPSAQLPEEPIVKRAAVNEPAVCGSLGCALRGVGFDVRFGMPESGWAAGHVRPQNRSKLYLSRGSAVV
jgi:hypothetical protein